MLHILSQKLYWNINNTKRNSAGAFKFINEIPLDAHSYYVKALEMEVATIGLLSLLNFNFCFFN